MHLTKFTTVHRMCAVVTFTNKPKQQQKPHRVQKNENKKINTSRSSHIIPLVYIIISCSRGTVSHIYLKQKR